MPVASAGYVILVTGTVAGDITVAALGGAFLIANTLLQAKIAHDVSKAREIAADNNRKVTDVHAMADNREKDRRTEDVRVTKDRRRRDRRRNADS